ncbi:MAG: hypothetical protein ACYDEA_06875, partial [Candidatus Dormibacteria bacterium]
MGSSPRADQEQMGRTSQLSANARELRSLGLVACPPVFVEAAAGCAWANSSHQVKLMSSTIA